MANGRLAASYDLWDEPDPRIPAITADHLEVLSNDALARAITEAEIALSRALRYNPRDINLHARLEADLDALVDEQRSRLPRPADPVDAPRFSFAANLSYAYALECRRWQRR